jgi:hypothetical protein
MHGEDYVCLGFLFGRRSRIAYLSDVSRILPRTEHAISKSGAGQLDLLILETNELHGEGDAGSCHLTLSQVTLITRFRHLMIFLTLISLVKFNGLNSMYFPSKPA